MKLTFQWEWKRKPDDETEVHATPWVSIQSIIVNIVIPG
jgi:hypothetical protein